jgi:hypothetical protein
MGQTWNASPPLGVQSRKSTTNTMKMNAIALVLVICAFLQVFISLQMCKSAQDLIVLQETTTLGVSMERIRADSDGTVSKQALVAASPKIIPTAPLINRRQVVMADLPVPVVVLEDNNATTLATIPTDAHVTITPETTVSSAEATATSTALDFNQTEPSSNSGSNAQSQSSVPRNVHVNHSHSHAVVSTHGTATPLWHTTSNAEANQNQTLLSKSKEPPRPHPHAGARDADGNWGYVADVTRIRQWMIQRYRDTQGGNATVASSSFVQAAEEPLLPPSSYLPLTATETEKVCSVPPGMGVEGEHGWNVVIKVVLDGPNPLPFKGKGPKRSYKITTPQPNGVSKGKILCGIYSYHKMVNRIQGASETWGWRCDGFLPVSTVTVDDPTVVGYGSVNVPHLGQEKYRNMWQKTRSILAYMYDHYYDDYEYFYLAGDDTHVIVENLRRYLYTVEQTHNVTTEPLFMGALTYKADPYNDGGAGYVLNRVALKRLVLEAFPVCGATTEVSAEDMWVAKCFKSMGIKPLHTVDAQGRQRFSCRRPEVIGIFDGKDGFAHGWGSRYGVKLGADLVSESSVTFHTFSTDEIMMKRHHAIIYDSCPVGTVLHAAVQKGRDARGNSTVAVVARR